MERRRQTDPEQISLFVISNQGLFSNNYIEKHLPTSQAWSQHYFRFSERSSRSKFPPAQL